MEQAAGTGGILQELGGRRANLAAHVLLFLCSLAVLTKIFTSDFGTHIALGRHIVQNHDIPTKELWNYPSLGMENGSGGEWGFEALLYVVYSAGGDIGVSLLMWAVSYGIFLLLYRSMRIRGANPYLAVLAIFAFSGFLRIRIQPRPEIFTYLFTCATIYLLTEYYFGERKKLIYIFPPMILVWGNMHPTYLMAFILYGAFFVDALIRAGMKGELRMDRVRAWIVPPVATGFLGLALCGLNPHGYGWLLAPLHMISRGAGGGSAAGVLISISELTPVKGTGFFIHYKAAVAFALVTATLGLIGRRLYLIDLFLFAIAFKGAWDSARAVSMMGLFLAPGAALQLTGFLTRSLEWFGGTAGKGSGAARDREKARKRETTAPAPAPAAMSPGAPAGSIALTAAVVGGLLLFGVVTLRFSISQLEYGIGMTEHKFSFRATDFLRKNPVPEGKMFNFFDIGGFLDWQLYPQQLTYIDGRTYNHQVFQEHQIVTSGMPGWQRIIDRYGINYMVLKGLDSSGSILPIVPTLANDPNWALVFSDGLFLVFVKRTPATEGYIAKFNLPKSILPQHIIWEAYHYIFLGVPPVYAYQTMSNMYMVMGNRPAAIQAIRTALQYENVPPLRARLAELEGAGGMMPR